VPNEHDVFTGTLFRRNISRVIAAEETPTPEAGSRSSTCSCSPDSQVVVLALDAVDVESVSDQAHRETVAQQPRIWRSSGPA